MDYLRSIEAVIPGARGQILGALVANQGLQTARQVAGRARVSPSRAGQVLRELEELGLVEIAASPHSMMVRLVPENTAAAWVLDLASLWRKTLGQLGKAAAGIKPAPVSLTVFGSFARGTAQTDSDIDVLAVHSDEVEADAVREQEWADALARWSAAAGRITGNPVSLIDLSLGEIRRRLFLSIPAAPGRRRAHDEEGPAEWLTSAAHDGIVLVGTPLLELHGARAIHK